MRIAVDTGVFSAGLSRRRRPDLEPYVARMAGNQLLLAAMTVSELRYGALVAGWGEARNRRLEEAIATASVIPVTDSLLTEAAKLRFACREAAHPLADRMHSHDLWIAASAIHTEAALLTADGIFAHTPGLRLVA